MASSVNVKEHYCDSSGGGQEEGSRDVQNLPRGRALLLPFRSHPRGLGRSAVPLGGQHERAPRPQQRGGKRPWRVAGPRVCNLEAICGAMVPIRKAKLAQIPFPTAWQEKPFATNQTMSPIFCLCFSVQTFVSRSEFGRGGGSNCFKRQSQDQMKAGQTHKWPGVLGARIQIMKVKKKLRAIKFTSAEYGQLCLPGNNF